LLRLASVRYMPTPLPRRNRRVHLSFSFPRSGGLPAIQGRSASASFVSRPAQRSLTFRPASSPSRPRRPSTPKTPTASSPPPSLRLLPAGTTLAGRDFHPLDTKRLFQGVPELSKNHSKKDPRRRAEHRLGSQKVKTSRVAGSWRSGLFLCARQAFRARRAETLPSLPWSASPGQPHGSDRHTHRSFP
jgi:hypothetical protein